MNALLVPTKPEASSLQARSYVAGEYSSRAAVEQANAQQMAAASSELRSLDEVI